MNTSVDDTVLTQGQRGTLRIWKDEEPNQNKGSEETRSYETLGYVVSGTLELTVAGTTTTLRAGDAYIVPTGAPHRYNIIERLTAIEAIIPN